ncbi:MAG: hypothetical protein U0930_06980 [Pirellulales bacterium]
MQVKNIAPAFIATIAMLPFAFMQLPRNYEYVEGSLGMETFECVHGWPIRYRNAWIVRDMTGSTHSAGSRFYSTAFLLDLISGVLIWCSIRHICKRTILRLKITIADVLTLTIVAAVMIQFWPLIRDSTSNLESWLSIEHPLYPNRFYAYIGAAYIGITLHFSLLMIYRMANRIHRKRLQAEHRLD